MARGIVGYRQDYCNAFLATMPESNLECLKVSRTVLHRWWQVHAAKAISNQSLENCTGFLFALESALGSWHSSTKSEQITSHYILWTSSTSTYQRGHFIPHRWLSSRNRLRRVRLVAAAFHYTAAKTLNNLPVTVRSMETLGSFQRQFKKYLLELSFCI